MPTWPSSSTPSALNRRGAAWRRGVLALTAAALLLLLAASLCLGAVRVGPGALWQAITGADRVSRHYQILAYVRLPRTLAALLCGGALAVCGALLQAVLGNALAGPNIIGVNAGSGLFTIALAAFFPALAGLAPLAAFTGALLAALLVYGIARLTGASRMTIVLSGVAVSSFLGAFTDTILTLEPDAQMNRTAFLIGSFSGATLERVAPAGWCIAAGLMAAMAMGYDLNVLALGEETAASLGMRTRPCRLFFLAAAALLAGSAVSLAGLLGFVGLIVPHAARFLIGHDSRFLLPECALLGAAFTLGCDILARLLFAPFELPVGIVMSFLGGPFFIYLLLRQKRGRMLD